MAEQRSRRRFLKAIGVAGIGGVTGCVSQQTENDGTQPATGADSMAIFHAGSLAPPFGAAEPEFETEYGADVSREARGSVRSTKKITELGRAADVLGVSDFTLIRDEVLPDYGGWYAIFATNAMSIQYREGAPGADEIGTDNWWAVLSRDDVTIGHSDPAADPGGYRAVMTQRLGSVPFDGETLYGERTYRKLRGNSKVPTGTETKLESQLRAGKLDYAFYYRSISSSSDLPSVDLQPEVDLSKMTSAYADHYAKATVETDSGTYTGAPIAYGITVPDVAEAPSLGAKWTEYMITEPGREILENRGLSPVEPAVTNTGDVPDRVAGHATAKDTLGPLQL